MTAGDAPAALQAAVDALWNEFLRTGALPAACEPVQGRLVRQVGRLTLPSGDAVFVKVMSFPRGKDKLRYLLRPLPLLHEARMLERVQALGVPCPEVLAVRSSRRRGLPFRSMLVLRALPVAATPPDPKAVLSAQMQTVVRLARGGLCHGDLHPGNFVPLLDGRLSVLDLQSMRRTRDAEGAILAMATRLFAALPVTRHEEALAALRRHGGFVDAARLSAQAHAHLAGHARRRAARCLSTSSEFERRRRGLVVELRRRAAVGETRLFVGGPELHAAWQGERALELAAAQVPRFAALRRPWLWPFGRCSLAVPADWSDDAARDAVRAAAAARQRLGWLFTGRGAPDLAGLQEWLHPADPASGRNVVAADAAACAKAAGASPRGWLARLAAGAPCSLLALVLAHDAMVAVRLPREAWTKRAQMIAASRELGALWHFRHCDDDSQELVRWLLAQVQGDEAVLFRGAHRGAIEALAAALAPAVLVAAEADVVDGQAFGRKIFSRRPDGGEPSLGFVVKGHGSSLSWEGR